jgi:2-polyprenyl-3-methyl-5-hydroxy-6-metoxy-1,4-benzoquinol methylase
MNRKQRRAAHKQNPSGTLPAAPPTGDSIRQLLAVATRAQAQNKLAEAARAYQRVLTLKPDHAEVSNNLGCVLQAQGKLAEASACFARALTLMPQLFDQFTGICVTLRAVLPPLDDAMRRAEQAWPQRPSARQLLDGAALSTIAADPLLGSILTSVPVRDLALEHALTALRLSLLDDTADDAALDFACALATQCFINEYVFATTSDEDTAVEAIAAQIDDALAARADIAPLQIARLAMYRPLHTLARAQSLLERTWPRVVDDVVTQQLREPLQERALGDTIPRLTPIADAVSQRVRAQYEENPYPRWVHAAGQVAPVAIDRYLRDLFPTAGFLPLSKTEALEVLVAGCGTGWQAIGIAQKFAGAEVLAVDLSLSSLTYAKRQTPAALAARIDYAQADILALGAIERRFDMVDASGVLHHMADPLAGWRILLELLKPGGLMHLGLYSELARRDIIEARAFIAQRGYTASAADIRRCRQELVATPLRSLAQRNDFFSLSECRDLLFHVQESRMTIPGIKQFIAAQKLKFVGFEFDAGAQRRYRALFEQNGWSTGNLDRWHEIEAQHPDTFAGMYHFWVQKP